mmetsp:Transcript_43737/g.64224  ORF Transcript_43737/g.64224 Transcript_43737/m.64224 type:complete len:783 (+) Transcript_43737:160-2508(+)
MSSSPSKMPNTRTLLQQPHYPKKHSRINYITHPHKYTRLLILLLPILIPYINQNHPSCCFIAAHSRKTLFPSNDEYEYTSFPNYGAADITSLSSSSLWGSPYGGYARATRSRLSKLPIRLVGNGKFDDEEELNHDESSLDTKDKKEDKKGEEHYFNVRDGQGRLFACRTYHEDEIYDDDKKKSIRDSVFNEAHEKQYDEETGKLIPKSETKNQPPEEFEDYYDEDDTSLGGGNKIEDDMTHILNSVLSGLGLDQSDVIMMKGETLIVNAGAGGADVQQIGEQVQRILNDLNHNGVVGGKVTAASRSSPGMNELMDEDNTMAMKNVDVKAILKDLKGVCAQVHQGYWSYEWCHEKSVQQFHVAFSEEDTTKPRGTEFSIESIIQLGQFKTQTMTIVDMDDTDKKKKTPNDNAKVRQKDGKNTNQEEETKSKQKEKVVPSTVSAILRQLYDMGDYCEEAGVNRKVMVEVRCCNNPTLPIQEHKQNYKKKKKPEATLMSVVEDSKNVCQYTANVCSPLLCGEHIQQSTSITTTNDGTSPSSPKDVSTPTSTPQDKTNPSSTISTNTDKSKITEKQKIAAKHWKPKQQTFQKDESIIQMLDRTLNMLCLQRNDGWWKYEFCHGKHTRQFHTDSVMELDTGKTTTTVTTDHLLGVYQQNAEKEKTSKTLSKEEENALIVDAYTTSAYFEMEYTNGEICDHSDVTDAAIKGGSVSSADGDGGIERATTVRLYCGQQGHDLYRVDEDSTCHYIFYVKVPELCMHELFQVPVIKEQIVKCLPVEEHENVL